MSPEEDGASEAARAYHAATKHSVRSVRSSGHSLDWETKPLLYKIYPTLEPIRLPQDLPWPTRETLAVLRGGGPTVEENAEALTLERLAALLFFSAGVTKKKSSPGGEEIHFRAAASTGALYEVEVYAVTGELPGLAAGVYHFCPGDFALRRLRAGDFRQALARAAAHEEIARAPATLILTAIFWRNAWKYQARAYRHCYWDSGTMLANTLATARAFGLPARIVTGFADDDVDRLAGIDGEREGVLELVVLGPPGPPAPASPATTPLDYEVIPLSKEEVDYPLLREMHAASALPSPEAVRAWRGHAPGPGTAPGPTASSSSLAGWPLGDTIVRRGSTRRFAHEPIGLDHLLAILEHATGEIPVDYAEAGPCLVEEYLIVNAVDGLASGAYVYSRVERRLELLKAGEFRAQAGFLCLEQELGADASAVIFFLTDLGAVLRRYGNRGYRLANLEAGIVGGRAYLGAYALGLGASGLTFYDDEVVRFFASRAEGKEAIFVTALGRAARGVGRPALLKAEPTSWAESAPRPRREREG